MVKFYFYAAGTENKYFKKGNFLKVLHSSISFKKSEVSTIFLTIISVWLWRESIW